MFKECNLLEEIKFKEISNFSSNAELQQYETIAKDPGM